jgi:hypothetical protein
MTTAALPNQDEVTFEQFSEEWLREFTDSDLSPFAKGQQFAFKLVTQWLDVTEDDEDLVLCDGSGDGGIDIAYLRRSEISDNEQDVQSDEGDTWYLIQSKFGTAFQGQETIVSEGRKVIATLAGENDRLSEPVKQLIGRLNTFIERASERDKLVLVFATSKPMREDDRRALNDIRTLGRERFPRIFDVADISLQTIWEAGDTNYTPAISLPIQGEFVEPSAGLRVGTIPLINLYQFLKAYREKTGNLDQLYERNVRRFLGTGGRINRGVAQTLSQEPEMFGLYNNGITIVVSDFQAKSDGSLVLYDPYVVNGCQTTKSIWNVLEQKLDAGGTGESEANANWRVKADRGVVVTKIVKEGAADRTNITKFTNSQNAVSERDLLALNTSFQSWAESMAARYNIFLEIQRGGWDSQKVFQSNHPSTRQFTESVYAFDLIKVYGAGWLRWPGRAYRQTTPFLPGGLVWNEIMEPEPIDVDDLYAAYRLQGLAGQFNFGRRASALSRRQTRFLYYFAVIELLRDVCRRKNLDYSEKGLTTAFLALLGEGNEEALQLLVSASIEVIDEYIDEESEDSVFKEQGFAEDLSNWLKMERLGRGGDETYHLNSLLTTHKNIFGRASRGQPSPRDLVAQAVSNGTG